MSKTITLPLLEAFDYLHKNNLTIDKLWAVDELRQPITTSRWLKRATHITTKPQPVSPKLDLPPKPE